MEYGIEKPSNKLLTLAELDSNTWVSEVKRIRGKKQPLPSAGLHALRDEYTRTLEPARALVAETLALERTLSDLVNQAYALTPAEIALIWQTAPPPMPILSPEALKPTTPSVQRDNTGGSEERKGRLPRAKSFTDQDEPEPPKSYA